MKPEVHHGTIKDAKAVGCVDASATDRVEHRGFRYRVTRSGGETKISPEDGQPREAWKHISDALNVYEHFHTLMRTHNLI